MKDQKNPREQASLWSRLTFRWLNPLVAYGNKHPLTQSDLPPLGKTDKTDHLTLQLELHWLREQERAKRCFTKPSLWRALFGLTSLSEVIFLEFMFLMGSVSIISTPIMLYWLLETLTGGGSWRDALPFAVGISVMSYVRSVSWCHGLYRCSLLGMRVRTAITGIIYKKVLNLSQEDLSVITSGHVMNLISNDLNRFDRVMLFLPRSLTGPLEVVGLFACMIWIAGWPALIGICVSLLLITYQIIGSRQSAGIRLQGSRITDRRITLVREIINGIRTVKMHAWEKPSSDIVKRTRKAEVNKYRLMFTIEAIFSAFENATIATFTFVLVLVFAFRSQDSHASVPVIFSIMASFSSIRVSAQRILGYGLKKFQDCSVSERRIRDFLQSSDFFYNKNKKRRNALSRGTSKASSPGKGLFKEGKEIEDEENANSPVSRRFIEVKDLTISFQKHKGGRDVFCDVNLSVEENDIVAVIGAVGSGKTTLLSAILGQVSCTKGKIKSRGTICHVPQVPWIFNGSVRENITFGLPYDEEKYGRIIDACALRKDFELFSNGDLTVIGERGVALSGGQRARVSLARAVYADAEIYLIDDTLSALDVRVGKHVYGQCIMGLLKDRLRVLVTHQLQYLEGSGRVVIMEKGTSRENSYEEFVASNPDVKASLSGDESKEQKETAISPDAQPDEGASKGLLLHDEERDVGKVSWRTYWHYLRAGFPLPALLALAIFIVMTPVIDSVPGLLMSKWKHESWYDQHDRPGIVTYIIVSLVGITCRFLQPFLVYQAILTCTSALHNKMTDVIIKSPVLFFDRNPVGRILNRFSADTGYLDDIFPYAVGITVLIIDAIIALIIPAFANLWFALGSLPPLFFYIWYGKYYLPVSREVTRLQSLARTPVYAHYSSSMEGLTTISVHQAQDTFMNSLYEHQDELSQAWFVYLFQTLQINFQILHHLQCVHDHGLHLLRPSRCHAWRDGFCHRVCHQDAW
ncbi:ATP-binding cassette subfamily C member 4 [Nematostella vectensis]|uniref:ATP-binding cassette subfamily C member 4 n=1 Tax=Nematostella vectensis TaxID=45351 RepID=UPI0020778B9B|nr:ATP-binding cassette subfamily C member 4 [Nematostella vectensis]XP_048587660.1 ATP-binding cassette subfamily C member 4 [Nematostella vectensis]XP_048587661.1 ATP-binding cassette subfamily C member 4 [Nematostella vectensis]